MNENFLAVKAFGNFKFAAVNADFVKAMVNLGDFVLGR